MRETFKRFSVCTADIRMIYHTQSSVDFRIASVKCAKRYGKNIFHTLSALTTNKIWFKCDKARNSSNFYIMYFLEKLKCQLD